MTKGVNEKIDEGILRWFGRIERMEKERIAKRVYVGVCAGSRSVGRPRKRCIDIVKECLKRFGCQASKECMAGVCEGGCMGRSQGDEPLTLTRCHNFMEPWKGGNPSVAKPTTEVYKGENFSFLIF